MGSVENKPAGLTSRRIGLLQIFAVPLITLVLYSLDMILFSTVWRWIGLHVYIFVMFPLILKYSYFMQRHIVFLNYINIPVRPDYNNPAKYGLEGVRNMYITTDDNVTLGVWHILPQNRLEQLQDLEHPDESFCEQVLCDGPDVIIYTHGNSGSRVGGHRIELYKVLRKRYQVIAFDYRGYADSSNVEPSEQGLVNDTMFVYRWVRKRTSANIIIWGHSLGTAISTRALANLTAEGSSGYSGLVLESPFTNMREQIYGYALSILYRHLPWFRFTILDPIVRNKLVFETDSTIRSLNCAIMILHAKDDIIVPFRLGKRLFNITKQYVQPKTGSVSFVEFESEAGYGHKFICRAPNLDAIVEGFVNSCTV